MNALHRNWLPVLLAAALAGMPCGCAHLDGGGPRPQDARIAVPRAIQEVQQKFAPDKRLRIFNVGVQRRGLELVLTGEVDCAEARIETVRAVGRTGVNVTDRIKVLPDEKLGDQVWGISCVSVNSGRLLPGHKAEMVTQVLMGDVIRVWKRSDNFGFAWYLAQSGDGYLSWLEDGTFVHCTREQVEAWNRAPLLVVTSCEECIRERPEADAQPVSDVVLGDLLRKTGEEGDWCKVELPDARAGFLPKQAVVDYAAWKQARQPTADNIERTARSFMGRPYLWGGYSAKGFDCSGLVQQVFYINGIDLVHNASAQARMGVPVPLDQDLSQLRKGDLLFFGRPARRGRPERITHVGIYLGDKLFIESSQRVRVSSLDPNSPDREEYRIHSLLAVRRVLSP